MMASCRPITLGGTAGRFVEQVDSSLFLSGFVGAGAATAIYTLSKNGGSNVAFLQTAPGVSASMAVDGGGLYWVFDDTIRRMLFTTGPPPMPAGASTTIFAGVPGSFDRFRTDAFAFGLGSDLQVGAGRLYFVNSTTDSGSYSLKSVATAGTGLVTLVDSSLAGAFATQGGNAYFFRWTTQNSAGFVGQVAGTGGPVVQLVNEAGVPNAITSDGQFVWYVRGNVLKRVRTGLDFQSPETIYTGDANNIVMAVLVDNAFLYWIENEGSGSAPGFPPSCVGVSVFKKAKAEGGAVGPSLLARLSDGGLCAIRQATQDSSALFFGFGQSSGSLVMLAK